MTQGSAVEAARVVQGARLPLRLVSLNCSYCFAVRGPDKWASDMASRYRLDALARPGHGLRVGAARRPTHRACAGPDADRAHATQAPEAATGGELGGGDAAVLAREGELEEVYDYNATRVQPLARPASSPRPPRRSRPPGGGAAPAASAPL